MKSSYVFDSYALLKLFQKESGHEKIFKLLEEIRRKEETKYLNAMNLGEIIYTTKRAFGDQKKIQILANIERLDFKIIPVTNEMIFQAAEYKASFSISFADCFVLVTALMEKAAVVTGDPEFRKVDKLAKIIWV